MRDDAKHFREGEFMFWNLSGVEVAAKISDDLIPIPFGEHRKLLPDLEPNEYYGAKFFFRDGNDQEWTRFKNSAWTYRSAQRVLMILLPPESPEEPPRFFVRANRPPPPPEPLEKPIP